MDVECQISYFLFYREDAKIYSIVQIADFTYMKADIAYQATEITRQVGESCLYAGYRDAAGNCKIFSGVGR